MVVLSFTQQAVMDRNILQSSSHTRLAFHPFVILSHSQQESKNSYHVVDNVYATEFLLVGFLFS